MGTPLEPLARKGNVETSSDFDSVLGFGHVRTSRLSEGAFCAGRWFDAPQARDRVAWKRGGLVVFVLGWRPIEDKGRIVCKSTL